MSNQHHASISTTRKRCSRCGVVKHQSAFRAQRRACRSCEYARRDLSRELVSARKYRAANRRTLNAKTLAKSQEFRAWMDSFKNLPCTDCGNTYLPCVMDWDHVRGQKTTNIGELRGTFGYKDARERVLAEMAKCDLVCANCHRLRTYNRKRR